MMRAPVIALVLATCAALLPASAVPPADAVHANEPPREIPDGVELTLADGDTFRIWTSPGYKTVWGKRRDSATGAWGERKVVFRKKNIACGQVDARTAAGAVAITAECDFRTFRVDQAPGHSHAIYSADTVTWVSRELTVEADDAPGISADGANAVWPQADGYLTWSAAGFVSHALDTASVYPDSVTATITDAQEVSYFFGAQPGTPCTVGILSRTGDATPTRQELVLAHGCSDFTLTNVDSSTVWWGDANDLLNRTTIARPDVGSPWAVVEAAPASAPGLALTNGRMGTAGFSAPGVPLLAVSSASGHQIIAQTHDRVSQTWGPPTVIHDAGPARCSWSGNPIQPALLVIALDVTCAGRHVVLTTQDGVGWRALRMGKNTLGVSPDGRYAAVPSRTRTHIISAGQGVVTVPAGASGRCELVVPDGPDAAILLTAAGRNQGWPTILKKSGPRGWRAGSLTRLPTYPRPCRRVRPNLVDPPYRYEMFNPRHTYTVQILKRNGRWTVRRTSY